MTAKFTKVTAGWYATEDGKYGVINDGLGYVTIEAREGNGVDAGVTGDEWGFIVFKNANGRVENNDGENIDWFDTKREAVAFGQDYIARHDRKA